MNFKLHTPDGVKDFLPDEYFLKKQIGSRIESVFHRYGYLSISTPMFEYVEVFEGKGGYDTNQMFKFLDRDGSLLTLRSDMTPPIARITATSLDMVDIPYRLCYIENSFRYNENFQGKFREFTEAGIELIGVDNNDSSAEVIAVAINSILATGLKDFRFFISETDFFSGLLEEANFTIEECKIIQKIVLNRDFVGVIDFLKDKDIPEHIRAILLNLQFYAGDINIIDEVFGLVSNEKSKKAIENLKEIYEILCAYELKEYISFDLSMIGKFDYYTGVIFTAYTYETGFSILSGGRYNNLIAKFGRELPAVGFAIKIDNLMVAISSQKIEYSIIKSETLVAYKKEGRQKAIQIAEDLRAQGLILENSFFEDIEKCKEYAKKKGIGGILYFIDDVYVNIINLITLEESTVDVINLSNQKNL